MVTENALTRAIGLLRKSLNDDSRVPKFIETVPTAGYRFIARVTTADEISATELAMPLELPPTATKAKTGFKPSSKWILASAFLLAIAAAGVVLFFSYRKNVFTEKEQSYSPTSITPPATRSLTVPSDRAWRCSSSSHPS